MPLVIFLANLVVFTLLRAVFFLVFRASGGALDPHDVLRAFYLGLKFDARLAAIVALPLLFFRRFSVIYIVVAEALLLLLYAADFGCYAYVHQRLNANVLEFLRNPVISLHMVWESYHVVLFGLMILAVLVALVVALRKTVRRHDRAMGVSWLLLLLFLACIYGKFSRYPLRWSDAYFSRNAFIGELALNPAQFLFETMREKPASYDAARLRRLYPLLVDYLGIDRPDAQRLNFRRTPATHPRLSGTPNIVLIQLESFAAFKTASFGNKLNASPHFDELARNGILFAQHYSPSEKTARALFAVVFGTPDVSPWQASAHNPLTVDQASIANAFSGYDKLYFLGGSANWSNIRGMLTHNLEGLRVFEEGSYGDTPVVDVWGVSDEDLMLAANNVLKREHKPFFAIIQTAGNHRPYTIPKTARGFQTVTAPDNALREAWFESNEELNSFRYLDHAIGLFFAAARREKYFENTVFVLYGDHGTRTGAPGEANALGDLSGIVYHVPLVIYSPRLAAQRVDTPSSHVDILPTVASLCGRPYVDQTLGIDVLDPAFADRSAAFMFTTFHDPPDLALVTRSGTTVVRNGDQTPNLASAIYEASRWMLYHNK